MTNLLRHAVRRCGAPIEQSRGTTTLLLDVPGTCLATAGDS